MMPYCQCPPLPLGQDAIDAAFADIAASEPEVVEVGDWIESRQAQGYLVQLPFTGLEAMRVLDLFHKFRGGDMRVGKELFGLVAIVAEQLFDLLQEEPPEMADS